jgi:hypothetical protein
MKLAPVGHKFVDPPTKFADRGHHPQRTHPMIDHGTLLPMDRIGLHAAFLDDIERVRKANASRHGALTGHTPDGREWKPDKDGEQRSPSLDRDDPHVQSFASLFDAFTALEKTAVANLERAVKVHPLGPWIRNRKGLGLKQVGRLLAACGDPYWRPELVYYLDDETVDRTVPEGPRTVSALWAYCGLHVLPADQAKLDAHFPRVGGDQRAGGDLGHGSPDTLLSCAGVAARRRKGQRANWSTEAKTRAYLCATSCLKQLAKTCQAGPVESESGDAAGWQAVHGEDCACSPYRVAYDRRRTHTSTSRPDWTEPHRHNDALRVASKEILRDLWVEARRLHCAVDPEFAAHLKASGLT